MKNTGQILRSKKTGKSKYTPITNEICQSKILTCEEKSILIHLLSLPEDWVVYKTEIWKKMNIGRDRFYKSWDKLVEYGYIISVRMHKTNGQIEGYNHIVYEEPNQSTSNQYTDNQITEIQETGIQEVNKVIRLESNKKQSNNLKNNKYILDTRTNILGENKILVDKQLEQINILIEEDKFKTGEERGVAYKEQFRLIELLKQLTI